MFIPTREFDSAFCVVKAEYPKISRMLAESFISRLGDRIRENRNREVPEIFPNVLRFALNESHIWSREDREPYKVLAGKFFGRRGGHAKKSRPASKLGKQLRAKKLPTSVPVIEKPNGQLAWRI